MASRRSERSVVRSSGNVFADLELKKLPRKRPKYAWLWPSIRSWKKGQLSQAQAAARLGINQPKISALANCRLQGFSVERLMHFLSALGCEVEIVLRRPRSRGALGIRVTAA